MIRNGNIAYELVRPVGLYSLWYARAVANRIAPTVLRAVPMLIIAGAAGWIPWTGWSELGAALIALGIAVLLSAALETVSTVSLLYTVSGEGVSRMLPVIGMIGSGMYLPLPLFPDWLRPVLEALPFRSLIDVPFRLFLGHIPPAEAPRLFAFGIAWVLGLVLVGRAMVARGVARAVVQGG
jgi:ABC-2 type transport system permease protein